MSGEIDMESPRILRLLGCIPNMVGKGVFECLQKQHTDGAFISEAMMKWWEPAVMVS
jgi:hypothetical protein